MGKHGKVGDGECNMPCAGNGGQKCGAGWRNSIYKTGAGGGGGGGDSSYMGCFVDASHRDLGSAYIESGSMTIEMCKSECSNRGFAYAGAQYTSQVNNVKHRRDTHTHTYTRICIHSMHTTRTRLRELICSNRPSAKRTVFLRQLHWQARQGGRRRVQHAVRGQRRAEVRRRLA